MKRLSDAGQGTVLGKRAARIFIHTVEGASWYLGVVGWIDFQDEDGIDTLYSYDAYTIYKEEPPFEDLVIYSVEQKIPVDTQIYVMY